MSISADVLAQFPLFFGVSAEMLAQIAAISKEVTLPAESVVFRESEKADHLHFLLRGSVALRVQLTSRPEALTVSHVNKAYESFGWSGVVPPYYYTAGAVTEEESVILVIDSAKFMDLLRQHTDDGFKVMQRITVIVADRLRNSRQALLKTI